MGILDDIQNNYKKRLLKKIVTNSKRNSVRIQRKIYFRRIRRNGYGRNCRRLRLQVNIEKISNRVSGDKQFIC